GGKRVLVVEDNTTNQRIIQFWLAKNGVQCTSAFSGPEAIDRMKQGDPFDAVILDYQLPEVNGLALAEEIRKLPNRSSLRLLLLTSTHLRAGDPRAAAARISVSIYKPIRPRQLMNALSQSFDARLTSDRKAQVVQISDPSFATRLPLRILMADDNRVNQKVGS